MFAIKYLAMRIRCSTLFDCEATGITGHYRSSQIPFHDRAGNAIRNQQDWNHRRNQQRNWETLLQIIGLRCQPVDIVSPQRVQDRWQFEFSVESAGVFGGTDLEELYRDCDGVPMIVDLGESPGLSPLISVTGPSRNIWFQALNTSTEI